jgi:hypothetical protein
VCSLSRRTRLTGNGPRAHPMNGTPAFTRSTRRLAHAAPASKNAPSRPATSRTEADDTDDLVIRETSGRTANVTHWSFGQLATIAGAPPSYLRTLPASIASDAINYGLQRHGREEHQLFVERDAPWTVHAITSPCYARVHHHELDCRVLDLMREQKLWSHDDPLFPATQIVRRVMVPTGDLGSVCIVISISTPESGARDWRP